MKGNTIGLSYNFSLNKTNDGFILVCNKAELTSFNGQTLDEKEQAELASVQRMYQYPPLRIDNDGSFVEVLEGDEAVKRAQEGMDKMFPDRPQSTKFGMTNFYASEAGKKVLNQLYANTWSVWVDVWTGLDLKEGESLSTNVDLATGEDEPLPAKEVWTNMGPVKGETNLVCLRFKNTAHSKDLVAMLKPYTSVIATNEKPAAPLPSGIPLERSIVMEVHTDPNTLQPKFAREAITTKTKPPGEDEIIDTQTHIYTFSWDKQ